MFELVIPPNKPAGQAPRMSWGSPGFDPRPVLPSPVDRTDPTLHVALALLSPSWT